MSAEYKKQYYERNKDKWKQYSKNHKIQKKLSCYPLIYKLQCKTTGLIYIGSTTQKIYDRKGKHMWDYRNRNDITARKVIENDNWDIYEIEKVDDKSQLKIREQYWIDNTECVNKCNATRKVSQQESDRKCWYKHREKNLQKQKFKREWQKTWGDCMTSRSNYINNLLLIDPNVFV